MSQSPLSRQLRRGARDLAGPLVLLGILGAFSVGATAQSVAHTFVGNTGGDKLGLGVTGCGDVDGDGVPDVAVGAVQDGIPANGPGYVRLHSGRDGSLIRQISGNVTGDLFGASIDNAGDCNGDNIPDLIVGAPFAHVDGQWKGYAQLHSGADGSVLHTFVGDNNDDFFGTRVCGIGDVNNDGHDDIAAGAVQWLSNGTGYVKILSGFDGSLIHHISGSSPGDQFGYSVDGAGDMDGDMVGDVVVGAWWGTNTLLAQGMVGVYSGATGLPIHVFWGDNSQDHLGSRVAGVGDVDNDGVPDFAAGASGDDGNGDAAGAAKVFSGATGALIYEFLGESLGDQLGNAVAGAGDVNGDGHPDIGVGAIRAAYQGSQSGRAYVFSGLDGSILLRFDGAAVSDFLGGTLSGVGDVNDDGKDDLIVGATGSDLGGSSSGAAYVLSLSPWTSLGGGTAGLAGVPTLSAVGELTAGSTLSLDLVNAPPSALMVGWLSLTSIPLNVLGGTLYANPKIVQIVRLANGAGAWSQSLPWPAGIVPGTDLFVQFLVQDISVPAQITMSNAVAATTP
jgi:hypothetical protein